MGEDRLLEADDAREAPRLSSLDALDEVLAQLLLDGQHPVAGVAELSNGHRLLVNHGFPASLVRPSASGPDSLRGRLDL